LLSFSAFQQGLLAPFCFVAVLRKVDPMLSTVEVVVFYSE
jgi:hypothetical protein